MNRPRDWGNDSSETLAPNLLEELDTLKGLLHTENRAATQGALPAISHDIPVLAERVPPEPPPAVAPGAEMDTWSAPTAEELEAVIDALLERQLPRLRAQLRQQLLDELQLRGLIP